MQMATGDHILILSACVCLSLSFFMVSYFCLLLESSPTLSTHRCPLIIPTCSLSWHPFSSYINKANWKIQSDF